MRDDLWFALIVFVYMLSIAGLFLGLTVSMFGW